jgi:hypothetical protein
VIEAAADLAKEGLAGESKDVELRRMLERGVRSEDLDRVRVLLDLAAETDEPATMRALVRAVYRTQIDRVGWSTHAPASERGDPSRVVGLRSSFLVRLKAGGEVGSVDIDRLAHVPTLIAVLRAGSLPQRRAAASRLSALLDERAWLPRRSSSSRASCRRCAPSRSRTRSAK